MNPYTKIGELMTRKVITVSPQDALTIARDLLAANTFHHLPVVNPQGQVVGILSNEDILKVQHAFTCFGRHEALAFNESIFESLQVRDVMTEQVVCLLETDTILLAMGKFKENRFHAAPVVDAQQKLLGILSTHDLLGFLFQTATEELPYLQ